MISELLLPKESREGRLPSATLHSGRSAWSLAARHREEEKAHSGGNGVGFCV